MSMVGLRRLLVVLSAAAMALPGALQPSVAAAASPGTGLFGFGGPGQVLSIDPSTGSTSQVASLFAPNVQGFPSTPAADPATHRIFLGRSLFLDQSVFPPVTAEEILTIDAANPGTTPAESPLLTRPVGSLLYDTDTGTLLGITTDTPPNEQLVQIDLSTGTETSLSSIPGDSFSVFAPAPALHMAYVLSEDNSTFPHTSTIYTVDTRTGTVSKGPALTFGSVEIAYDTSSAQLFTITFNLAPFLPARFAQVDPNTGTVTPLGNYNFGFFLEPGIAVDSSKHQVFATQDFFDDPVIGPITHIVTLDEATGAGSPGPSTNHTITSLLFIAPSITADSILADVQNALASGAIDNAGIANSLTTKLQLASADRAGGDCAGAASDYQAFINEVSALSGKHVAAATASQLISEAQFLIAHCP